jgi:hypothetical protein
MIMIDSTHDYDELTSWSDLFFYLTVTAILQLDPNSPVFHPATVGPPWAALWMKHETT